MMRLVVFGNGSRPMLSRLVIPLGCLAMAACATPSAAPVEHRAASVSDGLQAEHRSAQIVSAPRTTATTTAAEPQYIPVSSSGGPVAAPSRSDEISSENLSAVGETSVPAREPRSAPAQDRQPVAADRPDTITVQPGDTLFALSEKHSVALHSMIELNDLEAPYELKAGQTLYLPQPELHVVKEGETLNQIAARYDIDPPSLLLLNRIRTPGALEPGLTLMLPADGAPRRLASVEPPAATPDAPAEIAAPRPAPSSSETEPARTASAEAAAPSAMMTPAPGSSSARFDWPLQGRIVSTFGVKQTGLQNDGVNIAAPAGSPVLAADSGMVVYAGNELAGYGELLLVEHDGGWITAYAHNRSLKVGEGDSVARGQVIAEVGETGSVDTPQLHFEVRQGVTPVDPLSHLPSVGSS